LTIATARLVLDLHRDETVFQTLRPEWDELDAHTFPRRPYSSALWNHLWWRYFCRRNTWVRDDLALFAMRDGAGRLIAVAPMMLSRMPPAMPWAARKLQFLGAGTPIYEIRGLVARPEHQTAATAALHDHLLRQYRHWDVLRWDGLRSDAGEPAIVQAQAGARAHARHADYYIDLPDAWHQLYAGLSKNRRRKARKIEARLQAFDVPFRLRAVTDPRETPRAMADFLRLYELRVDASPTRLTLRNNRLANAPMTAFLLDYSQQLAVEDGLRVFQLLAGDRIVAAQIAHQLGRDLYLCYSAFDPAWSQHSVMTALTIEIIKWGIDARLARVNLSTGEDLAKLRWRPRTYEFETITLTSPGARGRALAALKWLRPGAAQHRSASGPGRPFA